MLRQLTNLSRYGRLRSNGPTPRVGRPRALRDRPELEFTSMLEFVVADHGKTGEDFFFVQIGAFDGVTADPLHELVRRHHWRGVLVEPQAEAFESLKRNYRGQPGLSFFNVAIGPRDGEVTLFTRAGGLAQVASVDRHLVVKPGRRRVEARRVPCWTVARLLKEAAAPATVDLLLIDAEGLDYRIIRSIDFGAVRPAIIHYEHMILSRRDRNACLELLAAHGYRFILGDQDTIAYRRSARDPEPAG